MANSLSFLMPCLLLFSLTTSIDASHPEVKVTNIRRAYHNGEHNAFTDLIRFRDRYYLTFRSSPEGHGVTPNSSVIILASDDLQQWNEVHRFHVPYRDTRDPHFLVFRERLFVYSGTWYSGKKALARSDYDMNKHLGYGVWSDDGKHWSSPVLLEGTYGHYIWRAASDGEKAYLCGRRKKGFAAGSETHTGGVESAMLVSDDGLVWKTHAFFQETEGNETAFHILPDGSLTGIGRRSKAAQLLRSQPPYDRWERKDLDRFIGGPLIARWGDRWIVGGRKSIDDRGPKTSMYWLDKDALVEFAELPSGGDNSYPGWVELSPTRGVMSWYSSHEKDAAGKTITAIYLADLTID